MAKKNTRQLNIVVSVRDQTKKALKGIRANIRRFSDATGKAIARSFKVGLGAAAVALAGFSAGVKRQFAEIDQLAKTAFRFGVAIENIRGLELAGKLAGLSLSEMTTILRDTSRRVSEAAQGAGEAQDAISELGLDAKQLNAMSVERQLDIIVGKLGEVRNANDRVRLAYDIMGRSGTQGLTLIGTSISGAVRETKMLGTALDDDIASNVQNANDELTRMKEAFKGIVQVAVGELAPKLTDLFKGTKAELIIVRHAIQSLPLAVEAELLKVRKLVTDFERWLIDNRAGRFLLGEQITADLAILSQDDEARIREIAQILDDMTNQRGDYAIPQGPGFGGDDEAAGDSRRRPATMPGITGGRLLTGAAQSSAERLAQIQQEADAQRRKEAQKAAKQRDDGNKILADLLRSAVQGNTGLGTLLQ